MNEFEIGVINLEDDMISSKMKPRKQTKGNGNNFAKIGFFQRRFTKNNSALTSPKRESHHKSKKLHSSSAEDNFLPDEFIEQQNNNEEEESFGADVEDNDSILQITEKKRHENRKHKKTSEILKNEVFENKLPPFSSAGSVIKPNLNLFANSNSHHNKEESNNKNENKIKTSDHQKRTLANEKHNSSKLIVNKEPIVEKRLPPAIPTRNTLQKNIDSHQTQISIPKSNKPDISKCFTVPSFNMTASDYIAQSRQEQVDENVYISTTNYAIPNMSHVQLLQPNVMPKESEPHVELNKKKYPIGQAPEILIGPYEEEKIAMDYSDFYSDANQESFVIEKNSIDSFFSAATYSISESFTVKSPEFNVKNITDEIDEHSSKCTSTLENLSIKNESLNDKLKESKDEFRKITDNAENISKMVDSICDKTNTVLSNDSVVWSVKEVLGLVVINLAVCLLWLILIIKGIILNLNKKKETISFDETYQIVLKKVQWIEKTRGIEEKNRISGR